MQVELSVIRRSCGELDSDTDTLNWRLNLDENFFETEFYRHMTCKSACNS